MIAHSLSVGLSIPAYIYDGIAVDELLPINKITGLPLLRRKGMGHNLSTRAAAMRYARESGRAYQDITVIVAYMGGGISVNLHHNGRSRTSSTTMRGLSLRSAPAGCLCSTSSRCILRRAGATMR